MDTSSATEIEMLPEPFVEQVEDALKHIYDLCYLQEHPLAQQFAASPSAEAVGQRLRRELVACIEALSPGPAVPFRAPHARLHTVLVLHYMEQMTIQETANQLGISPRQALRNLREAERSVATVLWGRIGAVRTDEADTVRLSSLQTEMVQLDSGSHPTDVALLLQQATNVVAPRATQREISLLNELPPVPVVLSASSVLAQQLFVSLLNYAVGQAQPGPLRMALSSAQASVTLTLTYIPEAAAEREALTNPTVVQLAERLGWHVSQMDTADGRRLTCHMAARCPTVLIIDDNEGLVSLLQRYLSDQACQVIPCHSGPEGLRLAREASPDAILLDVMMPGMLGWEVLQRLHYRSRNRTHSRDRLFGDCGARTGASIGRRSAAAKTDPSDGRPGCPATRGSGLGLCCLPGRLNSRGDR